MVRKSECMAWSVPTAAIDIGRCWLCQTAHSRATVSNLLLQSTCWLPGANTPASISWCASSSR